jgi:hypothetical protein
MSNGSMAVFQSSQTILRAPWLGSQSGLPLEGYGLDYTVSTAGVTLPFRACNRASYGFFGMCVRSRACEYLCVSLRLGHSLQDLIEVLSDLHLLCPSCHVIDTAQQLLYFCFQSCQRDAPKFPS